MKFELRPYQRVTIEGGEIDNEKHKGVFAAWEEGTQRPATVLATGLGKTVIFAEVCSRVVRILNGRPVILVHRDELVEQAVEKLLATDPGLTIGVIKADRHEDWADIVVASVQTLVRRLGKSKRPVAADRFTHVVVDECHHAAAPSYMQILKFFGCFDGNGGKALGVTATLARADGVGLGGVWQEVVAEFGTVWGIENKYLAVPHAERVHLDDLDLDKVKKTMGDWSVEELGGKMFKAGSAIAAMLLEKGRDPFGRIERSITFAPTVACAFEWAKDYRAAGIRTEVVTGETPLGDRKCPQPGTRAYFYRQLANQEIDAITSCMVLTEGFDCEEIEVVVIGRPTMSEPLYIQMVGRGLRMSARIGKKTCKIFDVVGKMTKKLVTLIDLGLPSTCECACDCELEHLCAASCGCPRDRKGKLKKPCVVCHKTWVKQPREEREPCLHYKGGHVTGCRHRCDGKGRPGPFDPDEEHINLDPEEPGDPEEIIWDDEEIVTSKVELFEIQKSKAARVAAQKPKKEKAWMRTYGGREFLPPAMNYEFCIFLHQWPDGTWAVGEAAIKGRATPVQLASGLSYEDAVREAEDSHPSGGKKGRPMPGLATEGQTGYLTRNGIPWLPGISKQEASDLINIDIVSKRLD